MGFLRNMSLFVSFKSDIPVGIPGRSSGLRIILLSAPSHFACSRKSGFADFVPDYSGGTAPEFNGIPF